MLVLVVVWDSWKKYIEYMGGLEYTTNEWNYPHSTIGAHSAGAVIRYLHCYIQGGYCRRAQATRNLSYVMAKGYLLRRRHTQYRMAIG